LTALLEIVKPTAELTSAMKSATSCSCPATLLSPQILQLKPAWLAVSGQRATTTETIKVNTQVASYQQAYSFPYYSFHKELALTPVANQRYVDVSITTTNTAVPPVTTTLDSGKAYVPPLNEVLTYDADGNLTADGRWLYTWDAENRLFSMVPAVIPNLPRTDLKLYFTYDGLSRRVGRRMVQEVYEQQGPAVVLSFTGTYRRSFTYDAWNLVQSLDSGSSLGDLNHAATAASRLSFVWGPDIGSLTHGHTSWQKAGGVGGLLVVLGTTPARCQFPLMDRLGNVMGYRRAASGTTAAPDAVYEYDAFGREVRSTGPASDIMPFRFSTKYTDAESGLVYYGYRFYDPDRGRWPNRDPMGERGGLNLYGMVGNDAVNSIDYLGNNPIDPSENGATEIKKNKKGQSYTRVRSCNIVIFLGNNDTVPQGRISGPPCSAAACYSCAEDAGSKPCNPGIPDNPIPGAPDRVASGTDDGNGLKGKAQGALEAAKLAAADLCKKCDSPCKQINISVNCDGLGLFDKNPLTGGLGPECGTKITIPCP
jgi:RHS repeat-associated protein